MEDIKSASVNDLTNFTHGLNTSNNKKLEKIKEINVSSNKSSVITGGKSESHSVTDISNVSEESMNNKILLRPKITIIREDNYKKVKTSSYPRLPTSHQLINGKDVHIRHSNMINSNFTVSQSPQSNLSTESLSHVNNTTQINNNSSKSLFCKINQPTLYKLDKPIKSTPNIGTKSVSNSRLHNTNEVNQIYWKYNNSLGQKQSNSTEELIVDESISEKIMDIQTDNNNNNNDTHTNSTITNTNNNINNPWMSTPYKQYGYYKSTPNINMTMLPKRKPPQLTKVNEEFVTHIARPLKPEFVYNKTSNVNSSSERDLSDLLKSEKLNPRRYSELDPLGQSKNGGQQNLLHRPYNRYSYHPSASTGPNVDINTGENSISTFSLNNSYEKNVNNLEGDGLMNEPIVRPVIMQRYYAPNLIQTKKLSNTNISLCENYESLCDQYSEKKTCFLPSEHTPANWNGHSGFYASDEALLNRIKSSTNGYETINGNSSYSQSFSPTVVSPNICLGNIPANNNINHLINNYLDSKSSGIYRKINQKQPNRVLPRRPRSLIQDYYNWDVPRSSNELKSMHYNDMNHNNHNLNNIHNHSYNNIDNEMLMCSESVAVRSVTPSAFRKYDPYGQQSYNTNTAAYTNHSNTISDFCLYDYHGNDEIARKTGTWTYTDKDIPFHPDSYIANKRKNASVYGGNYQRPVDIMNLRSSPTEGNLYLSTQITNNNNISSLSNNNSSSNNHDNTSNYVQSFSPISFSISQHQRYSMKQQSCQQNINSSLTDICSATSSLSDHTTNGTNCLYQNNTGSLSFNGGFGLGAGASGGSTCVQHRNLPSLPNLHDQHNKTLTPSQLSIPMVTWRVKDSKERYYDKKLLRLIEQLPKDRQNSIGLILLAMDVKLINRNSNSTITNKGNDDDIFCGGLEYRLREALELIQPKKQILNNDELCLNTTDFSSKSYPNKIIDVRSRKNLNDITSQSFNQRKEEYIPKEDGRESGIDPDTIDEVSTPIIGNSLSLNEIKYNNNNNGNTNHINIVNKPSVITVLRRLARCLAIRIANKRHSLASANQHVARNSIEEKLLRYRLSELNMDAGYSDCLMNSWNSLNSIEPNRGTIVNRFDRWHNNTIAVIQLLCQLARRLATLDAQLYHCSKHEYHENAVLLCKNELNYPLYCHLSSSVTTLPPPTPSAIGTAAAAAAVTAAYSSSLPHHLLNDFSQTNGDDKYEKNQILEQQRQLITQIKEAQSLRAELETCRRRLLESIPPNLKCDLTHTILGKLGRDFIDDTQSTIPIKPSNAYTGSNTINKQSNNSNTSKRASNYFSESQLTLHPEQYEQNQYQLNGDSQKRILKITSDSDDNGHDLDCQQATTTTTTATSQFLRQRVAEHLIEFLNSFVLSQIFETEIKVDQDLWESIQDELRFELSY
ncbi:unnamed protein product [Heterobilharzia americana]|nr:unnamed protein product [Heterobilharzia americana]CAH8535316.1 unnamed protein product [Heterobilharzia americana]